MGNDSWVRHIRGGPLFRTRSSGKRFRSIAGGVWWISTVTGFVVTGGDRLIGERLSVRHVRRVIGLIDVGSHQLESRGVGLV